MIFIPYCYSHDHMGKGIFVDMIKVTNQLALKQEDYLDGPTPITRVH